MAFESYGNFGDVLDFGAAAFVGVFVAFALVVCLVLLALGVASYVLYSRGIQMIAQRRGIRNSWMAWVPVVGLWILGSISDQYQYVVKGKIRNRRKVLLALSIATTVLTLVINIASMIMTFAGMDAVTGATVVMTLASVAMAMLCVVFAVFQYIALYDLYVSCEPGNGVLYLVLSVIFDITVPIFVFLCRKKDGGMPARKQPQPAAPEMPAPVEAVVEEAKAEDAPVTEEPVEEVTEEVPVAEAAPVEEAPAEETVAEDAEKSE